MTSHIKDLLSTRKTDLEKEDIRSEASSEGDPTVAELPEDMANRKQLIWAPNINFDLPASKGKEIHDVAIGNCQASGLDDCLEYLNQAIKIPLEDRAKETSLPPFHASPTGREIVKWIQFGVTEPSKILWRTPTYVVHRSRTGHMVVNHRKLNERAVSNEFPLPQQEELKETLNFQTFLTMMVYFSTYTPFYAWTTSPLFGLSAKWEWIKIYSETSELCRQDLVDAPVHGYAKPGLPYKSYLDNHNFG